MGLFDLVGQAGAGFTRGLATSEQMKFNQKEKERQQKEAHGYRKEQYELALRKQKFDEEQSRGKEVGELRQLAFKSLLELKTKRATDQNWVAAMTPEQQLLLGTHEAELGRLAGSNAATKEDYLRTFSMFPDKYGPHLPGQQHGPSEAQGPAQQPSANTPDVNTGPFPRFPGEGGPLPAMGGLQRGDVSPNPPPGPPRLVREQTPVPQMVNGPAPVQAPTYEGYLAAGFTPDYANKAMKDYYAGEASKTRAGESAARTANLQAENPFIAGKATSEIGRNNASANLSNTQAGLLDDRLKLDTSKLRENIRQFDLELTATSGDAAARRGLERDAQQIAWYSARSAALLRSAQAYEIDATIQKIRTEMQQQAKINPRLKALLDILPDLSDKTLAGTYWSKERANATADLIEQYGMGLEARILRDTSATAKPNPFMGTQQGSTVGAPPPGMAPPVIPPAGPYAPPTQGQPSLAPASLGGATPNAGGPVQGLPPELLQAIQNNGVAGRQDIINANPAPRRGKPKTSSKPAKKGKPALPRTVAAPNYSNKSEPTTKKAGNLDEQLAQKKKRLAELQAKGRK